MAQKSKVFDRIVVRTLGRKNSRGIVTAGNRQFPCALGRSGITCKKREGDGATPAGRFKILALWYRADRENIIPNEISTSRIKKDIGWCDAPEDRNYNRSVKLPYPARHENMWRDDLLYDWCLVLDQNYSTRMRGLGSAIFFHLATPDFRPTEGCVAIQPRDMRWLLGHIGNKTILDVSSD